MIENIYSLISPHHLQDILETLQAFSGISTQLIDQDGRQLLYCGKEPNYCCFLRQRALPADFCSSMHKKAGQCAREIGDSYIYTCPANLTNVTFPLVNQGELLGSVAVGPFILGEPDSTVLSGVAERYHLSLNRTLELYDDLTEIPVLSSEKAGQLQKLLRYLLAPLIPSERALLIQAQEKASQQAKIGEHIQGFKAQNARPSLMYFHKKEKELLARVRTGSVPEVKGLLNDLIGYVLFSEGDSLESMRIRSIELTTLLSRVAIDGGANESSIDTLNRNFLTLISQEQDLNQLCMLLQQVAENFTRSMFYEKDKGNTSIRKALQFIAENFYEHLDLNTVADFVQLSPSYLSTLFHDVVGTNFREYLCQVRVEESKRLLLTTEYALADIAVSVGFPDQSYFCKVFRRTVGVSPGKYRATPSSAGTPSSPEKSD